MIAEISAKIRAGQYEFFKHAVDQSIIRHISLEQFQEAMVSARIIEDYPEDK